MKNPLYKFLSNLSERTELPLAEMCRESTVNISGKREVTVGGVSSVKQYEADLIILRVCRGLVTVYGKNMELKSFHKTTLCISGEIEKIELAEANK